MNSQDLKKVDYTALLKESLALSETGDWYHNGKKFTNSKLSSLFHRSIQWSEAEQDFYIYIGNNRATFDHGPIVFFISRLELDEPKYLLTCLNGIEEEFLPEKIILTKNNTLNYKLDNGHLATFRRNTYQLLAEHFVDTNLLKIGNHEYKITS